MLVHTGASYGGVDVYLANLVDLLKVEAELSFFCSNPQSRARLSKLGAKDVWISGKVSTGRVLNFILFALYMPILRFGGRIDTFWAQGGLGVFLLPWARLLGFHTVITRHSAINIEALGGFRGLKHRFIESVVWKTMRVARRVICVSETVAQGLRHIVPESRVSVIPNWVPVPDNTGSSRKNAERALNVLFVGRLERFKGGTILIEALRKLNCGGNVLASLTIVGEGQCRSEMEQLATGLPVKFVGFQPDTQDFYEHADLFVNPSTNPCEGMPLTSLEAMSYGLPCIFSDIPQNREIVGHSSSALLFRSGDTLDLSAKLELCARSQDLLQRLGRQARKAFTERFCPAVASLQYLKALGLT